MNPLLPYLLLDVIVVATVIFLMFRRLTFWHPLTAYLDFASAPVAFFYHRLTPRPGAQVLLTAGSVPAVVTGTYGKGQVACVGLTAFGDPAPEQQPFWEWPCWVTFTRDLVWWTAGEDGRFAE